MRVDYEEHLAACVHCRRRQRIHRTVDLLLLCATTLSFAAFLLAALVIHRLELMTHIGNVHLHLREPALSHVSSSITVSLEAVAISGLVVSMLLWILVAIATPIPSIVTSFVRQRVSPETRDSLSKHAA
jgi:ABC-type sulfate transport system permease component